MTALAPELDSSLKSADSIHTHTDWKKDIGGVATKTNRPDLTEVEAATTETNPDVIDMAALRKHEASDEWSELTTVVQFLYQVDCELARRKKSQPPESPDPNLTTNRLNPEMLEGFSFDKLTDYRNDLVTRRDQAIKTLVELETK